MSAHRIRRAVLYPVALIRAVWERVKVADGEEGPSSPIVGFRP